MKTKTEFKLNPKQKTAIFAVMGLLVLITGASLVCFFLNLGILGIIVTLSVFVFMFIRFSIAYSQLKDFGYRNRGIEIFKVICPVIYAISFVLNIFSV
jgi:hypothetical protein